jgi:hypothetical protein
MKITLPPIGTGPWKTNLIDNGYIRGEVYRVAQGKSNLPICLVAKSPADPSGGNTCEGNANAQAIAALPECLAALSYSLTMLNQKKPDPLAMFATVEKIKAALLKAGATID